MPMSAAIEFQNVTKRFGDNRVVDNISLRVEPGELFFLLGPSGCGKTTLLRCLAGFYTPEEGKILIGGRDVTSLPPEQRDTGMVFQSYALWPHMSVRENVSFGLELRKISKTEILQRVDEALAMVKMTERADYKPNQLSGGQQQRVALARALVIRPACLLLDEPLSNLDAKLRLEMRTEIRRICKKSGLTAVYVTHDQKEALSIADRLAILDKGKPQQIGTPADVYRHPNSRLVANFIGETNFIEGKIAQVIDGRIELETSVGKIISASKPCFAPNLRDTVTLSIRPEVIHLSSARPTETQPNIFDATVHDSVYLGEIAEHQITIGPASFKVFDLNPKIVSRDNEVKNAVIWFRPENVVVLNK
jgi:iron(III) transport system ATP-binding protein